MTTPALKDFLIRYRYIGLIILLVLVLFLFLAKLRPFFLTEWTIKASTEYLETLPYQQKAAYLDSLSQGYPLEVKSFWGKTWLYPDNIKERGQIEYLRNINSYRRAFQLDEHILLNNSDSDMVWYNVVKGNSSSMPRKFLEHPYFIDWVYDGTHASLCFINRRLDNLYLLNSNNELTTIPVDDSLKRHYSPFTSTWSDESSILKFKFRNHILAENIPILISFFGYHPVILSNNKLQLRQEHSRNYDFLYTFPSSPSKNNARLFGYIQKQLLNEFEVLTIDRENRTLYIHSYDSLAKKITLRQKQMDAKIIDNLEDNRYPPRTFLIEKNDNWNASIHLFLSDEKATNFPFRRVFRLKGDFRDFEACSYRILINEDYMSNSSNVLFIVKKGQTYFLYDHDFTVNQTINMDSLQKVHIFTDNDIYMSNLDIFSTSSDMLICPQPKIGILNKSPKDVYNLTNQGLFYNIQTHQIKQAFTEADKNLIRKFNTYTIVKSRNSIYIFLNIGDVYSALFKWQGQAPLLLLYESKINWGRDRLVTAHADPDYIMICGTGILILGLFVMLFIFFNNLSSKEYLLNAIEQKNSFLRVEIPFLIREKLHLIHKNQKQYKERSDIMLVTGLLAAIIGLLIFGIYTYQITAEKSVLSELRPVSLFVFIEAIAFFFFRQFRIYHNEYKRFLSLKLKFMNVWGAMEFYKQNNLNPIDNEHIEFFMTLIASKNTDLHSNQDSAVDDERIMNKIIELLQKKNTPGSSQ